jgi:hypothetical protein
MPPALPELAITVTEFLRLLDQRQDTYLADYAGAIESRGWGIEDLENVPRNYMRQLDMDDGEIDTLLGFVATYLIGRQHGHLGIW